MRKRFCNSLFVHLFFIVFLATLPAFFIIYKMTADMKSERIERDKQMVLQLTRGLSMGQTVMTRVTQDTMGVLVDAPEIKSLNMPLVKKNFKSIINEIRQHKALILFDAKGNLVGHLGNISAYQYNIEKKELLKMLDTKEFTIGRGIDNGPYNALLLPCYQTVYSDDGKVAGLLCIILDIETEYNALVKDLKLLDRWRVVVSDAEGAVLYIFPESKKKSVTGSMRTAFSGEILKRISSGDPFGNFRVIDDVGEVRLGGFTALRVTPKSPPYGYILVGSSETAVIRAANQKWEQLTVHFLSFVVFFFAVTLILARRMFEKPLMRINQAAQQFKEGDLSARTGISSAQNEIADLAKAFDDMASALESRDKERLEAEKNLEKQASIDTLTGIFNRRAGLIIMEQSHAASVRNKVPMSLCYIDLDGFKEVNDTYGHAEGDRVLVFAAELLKKAIRVSDSVCRMGGDEFLLILPDCDQENAVQLWNRVQSLIDEANAEARLPLELKMSHGIATFVPEQSETLEVLMVLADERMYADKKKRKGAVSIASDSKYPRKNVYE